MSFCSLESVPSPLPCATLTETKQTSGLQKAKAFWVFNKCTLFLIHSLTQLRHTANAPCSRQRLPGSSPHKETSNLMIRIWQLYFSSWPHITGRMVLTGAFLKPASLMESGSSGRFVHHSSALCHRPALSSAQNALEPPDLE